MGVARDFARVKSRDLLEAMQHCLTIQFRSAGKEFIQSGERFRGIAKAEAGDFTVADKQPDHKTQRYEFQGGSRHPDAGSHGKFHKPASEDDGCHGKPFPRGEFPREFRILKTVSILLMMNEILLVEDLLKINLLLGKKKPKKKLL